jgi:competence protein ComEC
MTKLRFLSFLGIAVLLTVCPLGSHAVAPRIPSHPVRIHYVNVGQADAILLEFDKFTVMIDAGGEATDDQHEDTELVDYLNKVFANRPDLNRTIDTIIISHPHLDHTMKLPDVVQEFSVKNLIDGGDTAGSGIRPLNKARAFVSSHGGNHFAINDEGVNSPGFKNLALDALHRLDGDVEIKLLSGSRDCHNANNSSLVTMVTYKGTKFLFTGDAEDLGDTDCPDEIGELLDRFKGTAQLKADVLKVDHHGSDNGTDDDWMAGVSPKVSIISAGKPDAAHQKPGAFHAFQFGHPRESAVKRIEGATTTNREPVASVITMDAVRRVHPNRRMEKAVYCTCWDGNIVVEPGGNGGTPSVKINQ